MSGHARRAYVDPYSDPITYNLMRPHYSWLDGVSDLQIATECLGKFDSDRVHQLAIELGAGDGRLSGCLHGRSRQIICTDPAPEQIGRCAVRHRARGGFGFVAAPAESIVTFPGYGRCDLLCAFWSLTYPVQSFFGLAQLPDGTLRQIVDTELALRSARSFLRILMPFGVKRDYIFMLYDPASVEQQWVTRAWDKLAPFPGGRRELSLELIFNRLADLENGGEKVEVGRVEGRLICADADDLATAFLNHHLRGMIREGDALHDQLLADMRPYRRADGAYEIPASVLSVVVQVS